MILSNKSGRYDTVLISCCSFERIFLTSSRESIYMTKDKITKLEENTTCLKIDIDLAQEQENM
jgi:hypothetical protein